MVRTGGARMASGSEGALCFYVPRPKRAPQRGRRIEVSLDWARSTLRFTLCADEPVAQSSCTSIWRRNRRVGALPAARPRGAGNAGARRAVRFHRFSCSARVVPGRANRGYPTSRRWHPGSTAARPRAFLLSVASAARRRPTNGAGGGSHSLRGYCSYRARRLRFRCRTAPRSGKCPRPTVISLRRF